MSDAFDFTFSSNSFGFRPNRGTLMPSIVALEIVMMVTATQ